MSDDEVIIPADRVLAGVFAALDRAETYCKDSGDLYAQDKFQSAIPLATISIEESMKAVELATNFRRGNPITRAGWNELKNHKHKLVHSFKDAASVLEGASEESLEEVKAEMKEGGFEIPAVAKKNLIDVTRERSHLYSQFQDLRESCFYSDWNTESGWQTFSSVRLERQKSLAFFVLSEAKSQLDFLHFALEKIINTLRKRGMLKDSDLPYPPYREARDMKNFVSLKELNSEKSKIDRVRYEQGRAVMQGFIAAKSLNEIDLGIFSGVTLEYLKLSRSSPNLNLHPLVKAMLISLDAARRGEEDGEYLGMSGDADQTPDGQPSMITAVVVSKKGEQLLLKEFRYITDKDVALPIALVEKILRTEMVLERASGDDVTAANYIEALSAVGIRAKQMKDAEVEPAIKLARQLVSDGKVENVPEEVRKEIVAARSGNWDTMSSSARAMIATLYGQSAYPEYNICMTPTPAIEKWKARRILASTLLNGFFQTA